MIRALRLLLAFGACAASAPERLCGVEPVAVEAPGPDDFPLIANGRPAAPVYTDAYEAEAIRLAAGDLAADIGQVAGTPPPPASTDAGILRGSVVIAGELGRSRIIDDLAGSGALDTGGLRGAWEGWVIQVVEKPVPGVSRALVIAGSDTRGTVYGLYALSGAMGVSPWADWADVPIRRRASVAIGHGPWKEDSPAVRYRGLCLNGAAWGPATPERIMELLLRLRGNCLWPPAEPDTAAFRPDPGTVRAAISRGVVLGLPDDAPLPDGGASVATIRLIGPHAPAGSGEATPDPNLISRACCPWQGSPADIARMPSLPGDTTLVWPDDGYGHLRRISGPVPPARTGGAGVFYHLSYAGAPGGDAWLGSVPPALIREELTRAWERGARRLWVAAVGGIKPNEIATEFFLQLAWDPRRYAASDANAAVRSQVARDFGAAHAGEISSLLGRYYQLNFQRRPEQAAPGPDMGGPPGRFFSSSDNGDEIRLRLNAWSDLAARAGAIRDSLPPDERTAYRERVLHPIECSALANIRGLNLALCATWGGQGRSVGTLLQQARSADGLIRREIDQYDRLAGGKWRGFMRASPPHAPPLPWPPDRTTPPAPIPAAALLRVAPEGGGGLSLPEFASPCPAVHFFDVFNAGGGSLRWTARASAPWIRLDRKAGLGDGRVRVAIDWTQAPAAEALTGTIRVSGGGGAATVGVRAWNAPEGGRWREADFADVGGRLSIDPVHPSRMHAGSGDFWTVLTGLGYRGSVIQADAPPKAAEAPAGFGTARLDFRVWLRSGGVWTVLVRTLPAWPGRPGASLRYAAAFDAEKPRIVPLPAYSGEADPAWREDVLRNAAVTSSLHFVASAGLHTLKVWRVDEGIAFDSILLENQPDCPRGYTWPAETRIGL